MLDGLLTDVEVRDYGAAALEASAAGTTTVTVSDVTDFSADGGMINILDETYEYSTLVEVGANILDDDGDLETAAAGQLILTEPLRADVAEYDPVLLMAGDQTATDIYGVVDLGGAAETNLDDAGDPVRIPIGYADRAVWPVGHYDPPWPVLVANDLSAIEAVPGMTPVLDSGGDSSGGIPTGVILPFGGTTPPDGYLICDGTEVSRITYANLFAVIGTNFGEGDGESTFTLPPSGRYLLGADDTRPVGTLGGSKTIATGQLPGHSHGGGSLQSASAGGHTHGMYVEWSTNTTGTGNATRVVDLASTTGAQGGSSATGDTYSAGGHSHNVTGSTGTTGSGNEFWPLFTAVTCIIRY